MNLEKFTDRAKGFLQSAQTVAIRMNHQRISPTHILKALLEDDEGMATGLIQRAGGDAGRPIVVADPESDVTAAFLELAKLVTEAKPLDADESSPKKGMFSFLKS